MEPINSLCSSYLLKNTIEKNEKKQSFNNIPYDLFFHIFSYTKTENVSWFYLISKQFFNFTHRAFTSTVQKNFSNLIDFLLLKIEKEKYPSLPDNLKEIAKLLSPKFEQTKLPLSKIVSSLEQELFIALEEISIKEINFLKGNFNSTSKEVKQFFMGLIDRATLKSEYEYEKAKSNPKIKNLLVIAKQYLALNNRMKAIEIAYFIINLENKQFRYERYQEIIQYVIAIEALSLNDLNAAKQTAKSLNEYSEQSILKDIDILLSVQEIELKNFEPEEKDLKNQYEINSIKYLAAIGLANQNISKAFEWIYSSESPNKEYNEIFTVAILTNQINKLIKTIKSVTKTQETSLILLELGALCLKLRRNAKAEEIANFLKREDKDNLLMNCMMSCLP